jgi:hypothetical protein
MRWKPKGTATATPAPITKRQRGQGFEGNRRYVDESKTPIELAKGLRD